MWTWLKHIHHSWTTGQQPDVDMAETQSSQQPQYHLMWIWLKHSHHSNLSITWCRYGWNTIITAVSVSPDVDMAETQSSQQSQYHLMWIWLKHNHHSNLSITWCGYTMAETGNTVITTKCLVSNLSVNSLMWMALTAQTGKRIITVQLTPRKLPQTPPPPPHLFSIRLSEYGTKTACDEDCTHNSPRCPGLFH